MAQSTFQSDEHRDVAQVAKPQAMLVGPWREREFVAASSVFDRANAWPSVANVHEASQALGDTKQPPELIFLAQSLPGHYSQAEIDCLQQLAPLARLVIVSGSWCEGELRTGSPLAGVIRLYWYELGPWWQAAMTRHEAGLCPLWSLPLDHAQAGRWSPSKKSSIDHPPSLSVLVDAEDYAAYEAIAAALQANNLQAIWKGRDPNAAQSNPFTAGIWDGGQLNAKELERLTRFCKQTDGPVVALLDFPRLEHIKQTKLAGATAVLAKPYIVEELVATLTRKR